MYDFQRYFANKPVLKIYHCCYLINSYFPITPALHLFPWIHHWLSGIGAFNIKIARKLFCPTTWLGLKWSPPQWSLKVKMCPAGILIARPWTEDTSLAGSWHPFKKKSKQNMFCYRTSKSVLRHQQTDNKTLLKISETQSYPLSQADFKLSM